MHISKNSNVEKGLVNDNSKLSQMAVSKKLRAVAVVVRQRRKLCLL